MPVVSIIVPTHNRSDLLRSAVQSILDQTFGALEIVVVDDASTDNTQDVLRQLQAVHGQKIRAVRNDVNLGPSDSRNRGIALAQGELIGFLDDDDLYDPRKIEKQVAIFNRCPDVDVVYCGYYYLYDDGVPHYPNVDLPEGDLLEDLLLACPILVHAALIRRSCFDKWGVFDAALRACEDWELWQRFAILGCRFACVQEPLCTYRRHDGNVTHNLEALAEGQFIVLDRAFLRPELPAAALALKPVAYAHRNIAIACAYFEEGNFELGDVYLQQALPEIQKGGSAFDYLVSSLAHNALVTRNRGSQAFLESVVSLIAPAGLSKKVRMRARAVVEFELAAEAYQTKNTRQVVSHSLNALSHDFAGFVRNRGLYAMLFKALIRA